MPLELVKNLDTSVAAFVQVKNEDYWIELVMRVACAVFPEVLVMDNASQDKTPDILEALRGEGLRFHVVSYEEPWTSGTTTGGEPGVLWNGSRANAVKNAAIEEHLRSRWLYVIDGDEIQYETACRVVVDAVAGRPEVPWVRGLVNFQFNHPADFMRVTKRMCSDVRSRGGRLFDRGRTRWKEPGYDHFEFREGCAAGGVDSVCAEAVSADLGDDAVVLHATLHPRSSLAAWAGANDPAYRRRYTSASAGGYEPLRRFPKEALGCRYSDHNPLLRRVMAADGIDYV